MLLRIKKLNSSNNNSWKRKTIKMMKAITLWMKKKNNNFNYTNNSNNNKNKLKNWDPLFSGSLSLE